MKESESVRREKSNKCAYKPVNGKNEGKRSSKTSVIARILCGGATGFVNGFFGGGGGMIVVPLLKKACALKEKEAHATAIAIILPVTILSGFLSSVSFGVELSVLVPVSLGSAVGGVIGGLFLKKLDNKVLSFIFFSAMAFAGVRLCFF